MKWIRTIDMLPNEDEYVLGIYSGGNHIDRKDPLGALINIVRIEKGITEEQRKALPTGSQRARIYLGCDVQGNNLVPYSWETFGPMDFFGQDIVCWARIDRSFKKYIKKGKR